MNLSTPTSTPFVSVLVPIRNESAHIQKCLHSIQQSDWPTNQMEILVIDGMSTDATREIVETIRQADPRVCLIDNPSQSVPFAMNIGIKAAKGDIIIRIDGHAEVSTSFIRHSVQQLVERPECWCVGGAIESVNDTTMGKVIAASMSCPVGVGNSRFRTGNYEGYVDTLAFGAYWKWVFDRVGMFDEELVRNQDDELNARILECGGRIYLSPSIRSRYFPRTSLPKLWRQYYQYGVWRIRTLQKRGTASVRYLIPMCFVTAAIAALILAVILPGMRPFSAAFALAYMGGLLAGAIMVARKTGLAGFVLSPIVFAILHFAYGLGSLFGILWFGLLRHTTLQHGLSR